MKRSILISAIAIIASTVLIISACKKKDTTPPTITLLGQSTINQSLPLVPGTAAPWVDPGYTAADDKGNSLTSKVIVTGTVNPNLKGSYQITYYVTNNSGIAAPYRVRVVNIVNDADIFAGSYPTTSDTCMLDTTIVIADTIVIPAPVIITSDSIDNLVFISNFGALDPTGFYLVQATITGDSVMNIPAPQPFQNQTLVDTVTITTIYYNRIISNIYPTAIDIKFQSYNNSSRYYTSITHYRR